MELERIMNEAEDLISSTIKKISKLYKKYEPSFSLKSESEFEEINKRLMLDDFNSTIKVQILDLVDCIMSLFGKKTKMRNIKELFSRHLEKLKKETNKSLKYPHRKFILITRSLENFTEGALEFKGKLSGSIINEEIALFNLNKIEKFIEKKKKLPNLSSSNSNERSLASKLYRLNKIKDVTQNISLKNKIEEKINIKSLKDRIEEYISYSLDLGRKPSKKSEDELEKKFANFFSNQKRLSSTRKKDLPPDIKDKIMEMLYLQEYLPKKKAY